MKTLPGTLLLAVLALLLNPDRTAAQEDSQPFAFSPESSVTIDGTSNRDDWTVTASQFEGSVSLIDHSESPFPDIADAQLSVSVQGMSGGQTVMDRLMRNALKSAQHPDIVFTLREVSTAPHEENPDSFHIIAIGELALAGVTRTIEMELEGIPLENGAYRFRGSYPILMSDYDIERPTALFGALVTGNEVVVHVDLLAEGG